MTILIEFSEKKKERISSFQWFQQKSATHGECLRDEMWAAEKTQSGKKTNAFHVRNKKLLLG